MFDTGSINNSSWVTDYGFNSGDDLTVLGSDAADEIRLNQSKIGSAVINSGDGDDLIIIFERGSETDVIDAGSGDDIVRVGTDFASDVLEGGDGSDTVSFRWYGFNASSGATFDLATHSTNFENIIGSYYDDILTGDNNANTITGDNAESQYGEGDDTISGLGGNDTLSGNGGDDQIDGGTGADTITTGSGSDQIILRIGDGGSELSDADIITDFTDGADELGLAGNLKYTDLTIAQGTDGYSNDTVISITSTAEKLAILQNVSASSINYLDFASMATGDQSFTGTTGDDVFVGAAGVDTVTTNSGTDVILTSSGDDVITVDGSGNKIINGGTGTDSLVVNTGSNRNLTDYVVTYDQSSQQITFTAENEVITVKDIEKFSFFRHILGVS